MQKTNNIFVCSNCGNESPKWFGRCPACNEWNTCYEEKQINKKRKQQNRKKGRAT